MKNTEEASKLLDCLIVGGGPAGLTAAVYLARFRRNVMVVDDGNSRALWIPRSHNCAGFPEGVGGRELLSRMTAQAECFGAVLKKGRVQHISGVAGNLLVDLDNVRLRTRAVILATGTVNRRPNVDPATHQFALELLFSTLNVHIIPEHSHEVVARDLHHSTEPQVEQYVYHTSRLSELIIHIGSHPSFARVIRTLRVHALGDKLFELCTRHRCSCYR